ncbi:hypothetical protein M758_7G091800 [Ceratodon purpureus]|nr:hypothetical protein M758_7G091800 [Ceratodon purpureus]
MPLNVVVSLLSCLYSADGLQSVGVSILSCLYSVDCYRLIAHFQYILCLFHFVCGVWQFIPVLV